jgi:ligand-binding sensor domain-containing protein
MVLCIGTHDGLYRVESIPFEDAESVLDSGTVHVVDSFETIGLLAATDEGLYHSSDGQEWHDLGVPHDPTVSVTVSSDRDHCYAGTYPAHVYRLPVTDWNDPGRGD